MYLIDTNIFLEILLKQEDKEDCKDLLNKIAEGKINAVVTEFTVHGIEGILTEDSSALEKFLVNITSLVNLKVVGTDLKEEKQILELSKSMEMDFDDTLQYTVAKRENAEAIISYDTDFDKTDLERKEPDELL